MTRIAVPALALMAWLLVPQTAHCFYNASTGRGLSRDPIGEIGGDPKLYNRIEADAINAFDMFGLKKCGVESFVVKWSVGHGYRHGTMFRTDVSIRFKNGGDYDPRCCEYKQNAMHKLTVARGGQVILSEDDGPLHDDKYSRDDNPAPWSYNTDRSSPSFTTSDTPGFNENYLQEGDVIDYSFTAEQIVYSPGGSFPANPKKKLPPCDCEKNDNVVKKGPHTGTVKGTVSRKLRYGGAPATL
jgi:hypothetical protein